MAAVVVFTVTALTKDKCFHSKIVAGRSRVKRGRVEEGMVIFMLNVSLRTLYGPFWAASQQYISSAFFNEFTQVVNLEPFKMTDVETKIWPKNTLMPINTIMTQDEAIEVGLMTLFPTCRATTASSEEPLAKLTTSITSKRRVAAPLPAMIPVTGQDVQRSTVKLDDPSVILSIAAPSTPANYNKECHESLALIRLDLQMLRIGLVQQLLFMRYVCFGLTVYVIVLLFKLSNRLISDKNG